MVGLNQVFGQKEQTMVSFAHRSPGIAGPPPLKLQWPGLARRSPGEGGYKFLIMNKETIFVI
jgi:hypothetical protein